MNFSGWRYRHFHVSHLLGWLAFGLLAGLMMGQDVGMISTTPLIFIALILLLGSLKSCRIWAVAGVIVAGFLIGFARSTVVSSQYSAYEQLFGQQVTLKGTLSGDAQNSEPGRQTLTLNNISINDTTQVGEVFITLFSKTELKRGDTIVVKGMLKSNFASYAASIRSAKLVSVERGEDIIRDIRERFSSVIRQVVIEPMASLGLGFVVGQRSTLPESLDEQLKVVGLTHIVVASGYNLTILVRFMMRILARYSRYLALIGSLIMILGFVLFSGFSPSMNRAVIVTVLGLLAWYVGRRFHPLHLIGYVAAATALFNPMYVWSDLGWYLSFFAFGGILVVAPLIINFIYRNSQPNPFIQLVMETISAEIMALPLIAFAFGTLPVLGLVANVLVAPFIPAAMALTALTGLAGMLNIGLATLLGLPTTILIGYMIAVVEWLAALPWAQQDFELGIGLVLAWYTAVLGVGIFIKRRAHYNFRLRDQKLEV